MDDAEQDRRIKALEDYEAQLKPLLDLYNGGKLIGRLIVWFGGILIGAATFWIAFGDWFGRHWK